MNRLVIIGNGFDMAHGLKTSYMDFINWYWDQRVNSFLNNHTNVSEDCLCKLVIKSHVYFSTWSELWYDRVYIYGKSKYSGSEIIQYLKENHEGFSIECCLFFETILQSIETKGWVDIENAYYQLLKGSLTNIDSSNIVAELNSQMAFLQTKLVEYLHTIDTCELRNDLQNAMKERLNPDDFSTELSLIHI